MKVQQPQKTNIPSQSPPNNKIKQQKTQNFFGNSFGSKKEKTPESSGDKLHESGRQHLFSDDEEEVNKTVADKAVTDEFSDVFYNSKSGPAQHKEREISTLLQDTAFSDCEQNKSQQQ